MLAYNTTALEHDRLREAGEDVFRKGFIEEEQLKAVRMAYAPTLYTPNLFVRIGLFLLTGVILLAFLGLMLLMSDGHGWEGMLVVGGLITYGMLEFFVRSGHYRSGVDDALLWGSLMMVISGLLAAFSKSMDVTTGFAFWFCLPFLAWGVLRFKDTACTALLLVDIAAIIVWHSFELGTVGMLAAPLLVLVLSAMGLWWVCRREETWTWSVYNNCWTTAKGTLLLLCYGAGNVYLINEISAVYGDLAVQGSTVLGWFFWIWTVLVPFAYIWYGIRKKDRLVLGAGLVLIAAAVFTVRYYHSIMPLETVMVLGGALLVSVSAWLIRYLKTPKHGFTYDAQPDDTPDWAKRQIEALLIAQTMAHTAAAAPEKGFEFGGGESGGGGASGGY